jgi:hypothetical protein
MELIKKDGYVYIYHDSIDVNIMALEEAITFAKKYDIDVLATEKNYNQNGSIIKEDFWNSFCQIYKGVSLRANWLLISKTGEEKGRITKTDIPIFDFDINKDQSYNLWRTWWIISRINTDNLHEISDIHLTDFIRTCYIGNNNPFIIEMLNGVGIEHSDLSTDKIYMDTEIRWIKNPIYKISLDSSILVSLNESILEANKDQTLTNILRTIH